MLDSVVRTLEKKSQIARIRKLVFCACHSRWSKDAQNMSGQELVGCLQSLIDRHPSIVEFKHELYQIAIRLNHSSEYYTVANTICEEIETIYDQLEFNAAIAKAPVVDTQNTSKSSAQRIVKLEIQATAHPAKVACEIILPGHSPICTSLYLTEPWTVAFLAWQDQYQHAASQTLDSSACAFGDRLPRAWQASASLMAMLQEWYYSSEWQAMRQQLHSFVPGDAALQIVIKSADLPSWQWQWIAEPGSAADLTAAESVLTSELATSEPVAPAMVQKTSSPLDYYNLRLGQRLTGYYSEVRALTLNLDRGIVVSANRDVNGQDNHVKVWSIDHGTQIHDLVGHSHLLQAVVLTVDGLRAYSVGFDQKILGWDLATGQLLPFQVDTQVAANSLQITPDGKQLITGHTDGQIKIWDGHNGHFLTSWDGHEGGVSSLAVTDQLLATASEDGTAHLWNISTGEQITSYNGHSGKVTQLAIDPQGKQVVTAGIDCTVRVWNAQTGEPVHLLVGHERSVNAVLISPDGQSIISGSDDKTVKIWRLADGQLINNLLGHETPVQALATSGKLLATGGFGEIRLWNVE